MCAILYFFLMVCNKPLTNPTIIYENIKEIHILAVGGNLEFPILSHVYKLMGQYGRPSHIIKTHCLSFVLVSFLYREMPAVMPIFCRTNLTLP